MTTPDTRTLAQASLFRKMRSLCRTMRKTEWEFRHHLYGTSKSRYIRQKGAEDSCPLTFTWEMASGQSYFSRDWETVARKLGFNFDIAEDIILAADDHDLITTNHMRQIRRILLRAAGLKEPTT